MVVFSHFFGEVPNGLRAMCVGWIAVDAFFVLSGLLVGRLILATGHHSNFFAVFYLRRACRTFPVYFACVTLTLGLSALVPGMAVGQVIPLWSYFTFAQNAFFALRQDVGTHWLAPTWTLAVEEQFYLVVPALMLAVPRRWIMHALGGIVALSVLAPLRSRGARRQRVRHELASDPGRRPRHRPHGGRGSLAKEGWLGPFSRPRHRSRLAGRRRAQRFSSAFSPRSGTPWCREAWQPFLLTLIADAPEANRFKGKVLAFVGNTSFAIYLTHLPILWAAHAVFRHAEPSLNDASGWAVSVGCLPLTLAVAWLVTRTVERPITDFGRRFKWKDDPKPDIRDDLRLAHAAMGPAV